MFDAESDEDTDSDEDEDSEVDPRKIQNSQSRKERNMSTVLDKELMFNEQNQVQ